jgi:hypothetical protein
VRVCVRVCVRACACMYVLYIGMCVCVYIHAYTHSWVMGVPAGLKLNDHLDFCLGNLCMLGNVYLMCT